MNTVAHAPYRAEGILASPGINRDVESWREGLLDALREERSSLFRVWINAKRFLWRYSEDACTKWGGLLQWRFDCAVDVESRYPSKIFELDRAIEGIRNADRGLLLQLFLTRDEWRSQ